MKKKLTAICIALSTLLCMSSCNNGKAYSKNDITGCWATIAYYSTDYGTYLPIPDVEYAYMFCFFEDGVCTISAGDDQSKITKIPSYSVSGNEILLHGYTGEKVIIIEKKEGNMIEMAFLGTNTRAKLIKIEP